MGFEPATQQRCPSSLLFLAQRRRVQLFFAQSRRVKTFATQEILNSWWLLVKQHSSSCEGGGASLRDLLLRPAGDHHQVPLPRLPRLCLLSLSSLLPLLLPLHLFRVHDRSGVRAVDRVSADVGSLLV